MPPPRKFAIAASMFIVVFTIVTASFKVLDLLIPAIGPINTIALILAVVFALLFVIL